MRLDNTSSSRNRDSKQDKKHPLNRLTVLRVRFIFYNRSLLSASHIILQLTPCRFQRTLLSRRPQQRACRPLQEYFQSQHHEYQTYPVGGLFLPVQSHPRDHIFQQKTSSSPQSHTCGASTGTHSARWTRVACARASSQSTHLGIYSRNASLTFARVLLPTAAYTGRHSRLASG